MWNLRPTFHVIGKAPGIGNGSGMVTQPGIERANWSIEMVYLQYTRYFSEISCLALR